MWLPPDAARCRGRSRDLSLAVPAVRAGAAVASLGALLALIAGLGRTTLAMARHHDLPHWLAAVHPRYRVPHRAEVTLAVVICVIVAFADLRGAIGFSSFGVLIYYLVANIAAYTQPAEDRRYPKALQVFGALACVVLVSTLPPLSAAVASSCSRQASSCASRGSSDSVMGWRRASRKFLRQRSPRRPPGQDNDKQGQDRECGASREDALVAERRRRSQGDDGARDDSADAARVGVEPEARPGRGISRWNNVNPTPATIPKNQAFRTWSAIRVAGLETKAMPA
ncbi:uncharacterized transporter Mb2022c [Arthrobacter sp. Hiyo8]|nr:uncharacterized transporter Mb2022c [Arthrobacter sp. Hiyo8]